MDSPINNAMSLLSIGEELEEHIASTTVAMTQITPPFTGHFMPTRPGTPARPGGPGGPGGPSGPGGPGGPGGGGHQPAAQNIATSGNVLRAHLLHRFLTSSFQEGCPLCRYAIYDTKNSLCYEWTLLCYIYDTMALMAISDSLGILADTQLHCVGTGCSNLAIPHPFFYKRRVSATTGV
jgi:hypothetical protein